MLLSDGFTATSHGETGAVTLVGAHIGGLLDCTGAVMHNDSGPAIVADSLEVAQSVLLFDGSPPPAAVRMWRLI